MLTRTDLRGYEGDLSAVLPATVRAPIPRSPTRSARSSTRCASGATRRSASSRSGSTAAILLELRVPHEELAARARAARSRSARRARVRVRPDPRLPRVAARGRARSTSGTGVHVRELVVPVDRAGLYVPGGRAPLPVDGADDRDPGARSPACREIVLCVPPDSATGNAARRHLAAAALAGVDEVYRVGGAQAIAAMAYGTESIRAGRRRSSARATATSRRRSAQVQGVVGIESLAGRVGARGVADDTDESRVGRRRPARAGRARSRRRSRS